METLFTESFLETLDTHMSCYYDKWTTRIDYLSFLAYMEKSMYSNWRKEPGLAFFEHNKLRVFFGQKQIKKVRKWKLDLIISRLMDGNVVFRTEYDQKGGKTRAYGYHIGFGFDQKQTVFGLKSEKTNQKLIDFVTPDVDLADTDVRAQYELLTSDRFQIDVSSALNWVENAYHVKREISLNQLRAYTRMIIELNAKRIFVVKGEKSGRVFSSYNTIKKALRPFCSIDGEELQNIDLKSSQPLILASLLNEKFPCQESNYFFKLVSEEDIYNWFLEKANNKGINSYKVFDSSLRTQISYNLRTREDSKLAFMRFIFNNSNRGPRPVYEHIFKQEFPSLFTKVQQFENLAIELQSLESKVFIPVATEFSQRGCVSIHDGLSFKSGLYSEILLRLESMFDKYSISGYTLI